MTLFLVSAIGAIHLNSFSPLTIGTFAAIDPSIFSQAPSMTFTGEKKTEALNCERVASYKNLWTTRGI